LLNQMLSKIRIDSPWSMKNESQSSSRWVRPNHPAGHPKDSPAPTNHMRLSDLPSLASYLTRLGSDRPVVDKTGLKGNFAIDFDVSEAMPATQSDGGPPSNAAVYEATIEGLQGQLGLKVVPMKAVEVLVIDRAEQPTPN
jgi:uncharacterized protein (TIGR03435 family)